MQRLKHIGAKIIPFPAICKCQKGGLKGPLSGLRDKMKFKNKTLSLQFQTSMAIKKKIM